MYQEEIQHRADISRRLVERRTHRRRRRGRKAYRAPRFDNRTQPDGWLPPSMESIVSNQEHRILRLARATGAARIIIETAKFDTQKLLKPDIKGTEYQRGPLYRSHLRAYVAERENHRCAYCGLGDWEDATRFNVDHVRPRSRGGPTNIRNTVWSCQPCNQKKGNRPVEEFLAEEPERLARITGRRRPPLAAAGSQKWRCDALTKRLRERGITVETTTGADTAAVRREGGIPKTHANDAACSGARQIPTELRNPAGRRGRRTRPTETDQGTPDRPVPRLAAPAAERKIGAERAGTRAPPEPGPRDQERGPRSRSGHARGSSGAGRPSEPGKTGWR